ncbi:hypothetical protein PR202_gb14989 [Eleusine coracana subsp. coracana]|uniref:Vacuolar membrane protease n=1 Tax=Eleusine coracana subsp. coracana TaxID=191504 RepID=A0AAV5EUD7_ELECO|nr:hypothetical protein PR202_gb14989 [Eleusine coracana subsp. coracana]
MHVYLFREGAGDCSSCVGVMLELARGVAQWAHGFKGGVLFLFNTGEEEGLDGAHSFMTQHDFLNPMLNFMQHHWRNSVRFAIDLEAMGISGRSTLFQGTDHWALESFAAVAKYPSAQIASQDVFCSGAIKSATDFQIYHEVAGLPGLDFAYTDTTSVYHTKGKYMVVYPQRLATMFHNSIILQSLLIWGTSLLMGGHPGLVSFGISCLSIILMLIFSITLPVVVAFLLPLTCSFPVPYVANPWLAVGLFGSPALLGAFIGQHIGFVQLKKHLRCVYSKTRPGLADWVIIYSPHLACFACFCIWVLEATLSPVRLPKQLKVVTLVLGLAAPVVFSAGLVVRMADVIVGSVVRADRNPGELPDWLGNVVVSVAIAIVVCFMFVYLLSYVHISGDKRTLGLLLCAFFGVSFALVSSGIAPAFTEDIARAVNVVHVVDTTGINDGNTEPLSYISLFSNTPGKLMKELVHLGDEDFSCGRNMTIDFVTFTMKYGCWSYKESNTGWGKSEVPVLLVESDSVTDGVRQMVISVDTKSSTRWALGINKQEIDDFTVRVDSENLVQPGGKTEVDGWHTIQFAGGKNSPTKFQLTLFWSSNATHKSAGEADNIPLLLKLRTDVNRVTPKVARVLEKLPAWCSPFGKSTSPYTLAFLTDLRADI